MRARAVLIAALAAVALAGCGGEEEEASGSGGGGDAKPSATASGGSAEDAVAATMKDFQFAPRKITVAQGGKVTWTDEDTANHNVKFKTGGAPAGIDNLREGESASVTFDEPGSYAFVCTYHPNMKGTVDVR